jgi:hypothetical protein
MAPNPGSPAIDQGSNAATAAAGLTTEQRSPGFFRVFNGTVDIGAVEVQPAPVPVVVGPASLPRGRFGATYAQTITASGPPGPFAFAVTAGALPPGLTLSGGVLSGTPTAAGTFGFTVTATNGALAASSRTYTLTIDPIPPVATAFRARGVSRVRVRDGATGAVRGVLTPFKGFGGPLRLQLLDINGDGSLDLVVRAVIHGKRRKKVYDAVTLAPL